MKGTTYNDDAVIEWLDFPDPEDSQLVWRVNVTLLLSNYQCIYGQGCPSIKGDLPDPATGCCSQGVKFVDDEDFDNIEKQVDRLTYYDAAHLDHINNVGWWMKSPGSTIPYKTRKKGGRCIFANPEPEGPHDPPMGCAFHHLAIRTGEQPEDTKPRTCMTVPFTVRTHFDSFQKVDVMEIGGVSASSWGGTDGGVDEADGKHYDPYFDYWCMDTPDAYSGKEKLYTSSEVTLVKIMGRKAYDRMVGALATYGERRFKMSGETRNNGKPMIADIVSLNQSLRERRKNT